MFEERVRPWRDRWILVWEAFWFSFKRKAWKVIYTDEIKLSPITPGTDWFVLSWSHAVLSVDSYQSHAPICIHQVVYLAGVTPHGHTGGATIVLWGPLFKELHLVLSQMTLFLLPGMRPFFLHEYYIWQFKMSSEDVLFCQQAARGHCAHRAKALEFNREDASKHQNRISTPVRRPQPALPLMYLHHRHILAMSYCTRFRVAHFCYVF